MEHKPQEAAHWLSAGCAHPLGTVCAMMLTGLPLSFRQELGREQRSKATHGKDTSRRGTQDRLREVFVYR